MSSKLLSNIKLDHLVLLEANYYYELLTRNGGIRHAQCMLLLGKQMHEKSIVINRSIIVPMTLQSKSPTEANFNYDSKQLTRRVRLIRETNPDLNTCGVLLVNEDLYDYTSIITKLQNEFQSAVIFFYEPKGDLKEGLKLKAFVTLEDHDERPVFRRIDYKLQNIDVSLDLKGEKAIEGSFLACGREDIKEEPDFVRRLVREIDRMIEYLKVPDNNNSEVLRHISLLVSQLKKGATEDIEEEVMNKESEINALNIICEQWEMDFPPFR